MSRLSNFGFFYFGEYVFMCVHVNKAKLALAASQVLVGWQLKNDGGGVGFTIGH